ncbi:hypothetical protein FJT64_001680 [Amphibalanus amphitrite]|uniref:Uncharacterized protein n=1 Tax=Amphibalanus amphitrite TaxID=1232801 RepID=A0A6A4XEK0_AMPAM|nr:hypothetical protein FJT64_001680 [Amphibalanus amphitrite]
MAARPLCGWMLVALLLATGWDGGSVRSADATVLAVKRLVLKKLVSGSTAGAGAGTGAVLVDKHTGAPLLSVAVATPVLQRRPAPVAVSRAPSAPASRPRVPPSAIASWVSRLTALAAGSKPSRRPAGASRLSSLAASLASGVLGPKPSRPPAGSARPIATVILGPKPSRRPEGVSRLSSLAAGLVTDVLGQKPAPPGHSVTVVTVTRTVTATATDPPSASVTLAAPGPAVSSTPELSPEHQQLFESLDEALYPADPPVERRRRSAEPATSAYHAYRRPQIITLRRRRCASGGAIHQSDHICSTNHRVAYFLSDSIYNSFAFSVYYSSIYH